MNNEQHAAAYPDDAGARTRAAFEKLLREMKRLTVELVEKDDFSKAQEVTASLRSASELAARVRSIVQSDDPGEIRLMKGAGLAAESPRVADPDDYPCYFRRGNTLVKVGLRRDRINTYQHKLARRDFEEIRDVLLRFARGREEFEALRVIAQVRQPSYQVYLLLGALQEAGCLASPTRGTYRFVGPFEVEDFDVVWDRFPFEEVGG